MKDKQQKPTGRLELRSRYGSDRTPEERRRDTEQVITHACGILVALTLLSLPFHTDLSAWGAALLLAASVSLGITLWLHKHN
jgi:hypothetical protein